MRNLKSFKRKVEKSLGYKFPLARWAMRICSPDGGKTIIYKCENGVDNAVLLIKDRHTGSYSTDDGAELNEWLRYCYSFGNEPVFFSRVWADKAQYLAEKREQDRHDASSCGFCGGQILPRSDGWHHCMECDAI